MMTASWRIAALCAAAFTITGTDLASAEVTVSSSNPPVDAEIGTRLGALMGVEASSLAGVSGNRLRRIGSPFRGGDAAETAAAPGRLSAAALDALPPREGDAQWRCLTEAIYFEARGEAIDGQYAVAEVILNRVDSTAYPGTICGVVHQGTGRPFACQFTYTCDGSPEVVSDRRAWHRAGGIAAIMMDGAPRPLTEGATHYHADWVSPHWAQVYPQTARHGTHLFYRQQY